jgi:hypothetical protein
MRSDGEMAGFPDMLALSLERAECANDFTATKASPAPLISLKTCACDHAGKLLRLC